jgi:hypothetical protein
MNEQNDGRHDFDFFIGTWRGHNRRLKQRLQGCTEWEEFPTTITNHTILGGLGSFEEVRLEREAGVQLAITLRLFNPQTREWSIYWAVGGAGNGALTPMVGRFENGRGVFYAFEIEATTKKHVLVRFIWSRISANFAQWEQAFSEDGGVTWETNWVMEHSRVGA